MTTSIWTATDSGSYNWNDSFDWSDGIPAADGDAEFSNDGSYSVYVNTAQDANSILFSAASADFTESVNGSLNLTGTFTLADGTVYLSAANTFAGGTVISGGTMFVRDAGALGAGQVTMQGGSMLVGMSMDLSLDTLSFAGDATIGIRHTSNLDLHLGSLNIDAPSTLHFGSIGNDGYIVFHADSVNVSADYAIDLDKGRIIVGDDNFSTLTADATSVSLAAFTRISANSHDLDIHGLTGDGMVYNKGSWATLSLHGDTEFDGRIGGRFDVHVFNSATLNGFESFAGTAEIEGAQATLTIGGDFHETVRFNAGGELVINPGAEFTGTIQNFDGDATIDLSGISENAALSYDTETHDLTVTDGNTVMSLHFDGTYVTGNFALTTDNNGGADLNWQVAASRLPPELHHDAALAISDWAI